VENTAKASHSVVSFLFLPTHNSRLDESSFMAEKTLKLSLAKHPTLAQLLPFYAFRVATVVGTTGALS